MTPEQKAAFIFSQVACALAQIEGMKVMNTERERNGLALAYDEQAFLDVPIQYGITHNAVVEFFRS